jgi:hypothetical protein
MPRTPHDFQTHQQLPGSCALAGLNPPLHPPRPQLQEALAQAAAPAPAAVDAAADEAAAGAAANGAGKGGGKKGGGGGEAGPPNLKGVIGGLLPYGPSIAEHVVASAGLDPARRPASAPLEGGEAAALFRAVQDLEAWFAGLEAAAPKGFISAGRAGGPSKRQRQKQAAAAAAGAPPGAQSGAQSGEAAAQSEAQSGAALVYEDFNPLPLAQGGGDELIEFGEFDAALDEFYSKARRRVSRPAACRGRRRFPCCVSRAPPLFVALAGLGLGRRRSARVSFQRGPAATTPGTDRLAAKPSSIPEPQTPTDRGPARRRGQGGRGARRNEPPRPRQARPGRAPAGGGAGLIKM